MNFNKHHIKMNNTFAYANMPTWGDTPSPIHILNNNGG
nr:MAG TPA: hypothetical protein [Caudoviricetes sp.]